MFRFNIRELTGEERYLSAPVGQEGAVENKCEIILIPAPTSDWVLVCLR